MSEKVLVKQLLLSSNYWALNKTVVKIFGIETAFLLSNLAEAEQMMSDNDGWFYQTSDTLQELTTLSRYKQDKAIEDLEKSGILERDVRGLPAKRYFKLDYKSLANKIVNNSQTRVEKNDKLELKKLTTNKESINKEIKNKETIQKSPAKAEQSIPYKEIIEYLNEKTGKKISYRSNGNKKLIRARINEGYTVEDFKKVIDNKVNDWFGKGIKFSNGKPAENYLHPSTLFIPKNFDRYLNEALSKQPKETKVKANTDWREDRLE